MLANNYLFGRKYGASLLENLVAYYAFENNVVDSHNGHNGRENGSFTYTSGIINICWRKFYNTWVVVSNHIDFQFSNGLTDISFSVSFWFVKTDTSYRSIINKYGSTDKEWSIGITGQSDGPAEFKIYSDSSNYLTFSGDLSYGGVINNNTFYHMVFTWDGVDCKIYKNGSLLSSVTKIETGAYTGIVNSTQELYMGRLGDGTQNNGTTSFDELGIWKNRVLTQRDVDLLYNSGIGIAYPLT